MRETPILFPTARSFQGFIMVNAKSSELSVTRTNRFSSFPYKLAKTMVEPLLRSY
ncbi:hypothetical protein [Sporolactobacillus spathodeae]|uniref:hypothetical protein n=1 Tax=Sporolactobacillus spathodeae TaxID=1465502 RepID=UPI0039E856FF